MSNAIAQYGMTAIAITVVICATILVLDGKILISDETARGGAVLVFGIISGWLGLKRPGDI
jgi:hypothetical protein